MLKSLRSNHTQHFIFREWNFCYPLILFLAIGINWPLILHPNTIPMTSLTQVTDFLVAHLPYAQYIHHMWAEFGQPPLWNSVMLSGMPLVADPLAGYGYLPNWLLFIHPHPLSYTILFVLHLAWTGLGLFLFLKNEPLHPAAALFGAIAWMATPRLIGYMGSGQVSTIFALAWYPWFLIALRRMHTSMRARSGLLSGAVLAIIILADIRWGFFAALFGFSYLFSHLIRGRVQAKSVMGMVILFIISTLVLSAVQTFPLFELVQQASRTQLSTADRAIFALDFQAFLGLLAPQFGVLHEFITYLGISTLCVAFFGVSKRQWFWLSLITLSAMYALGANAFLFPFISNLIPGFSWLRVPSRMWFFVAFAGSILAAYGFNQLIILSKHGKIKPWFLPISVGLAFFSILLAAGMVRFVSPIPKGLLSFAVNTPVVLAVVNVALIRRRPAVLYLLLPLLIADLMWFNASVFRAVPIPAPPPALTWLQEQEGLFRVYSPSYSLPQPHLLQSADGVNPLHLETYTQFMHQASHLDTGRYSVSLPDLYVDSHTSQDDREALSNPDVAMLGLLNVKYVVADFPVTGLDEPIQMFGETRIYQNPQFRERVWLQGAGQVEILYWSPDRIVISHDGTGGQVVVSEINYPGWVVLVNGKRSPLVNIEGIFRGVNVSGGKQEIIFSYQPTVFFVSLFVTFSGWVCILISARSYVRTLLAQARSAFS